MKTISICICLIVGMFACAVAPIMLASIKQSKQNATPQTGSATPDDSKYATFVYDVVSIKPYKPDPKATSEFMGWHETPDGFTGTNILLLVLIDAAYRNDRAQMSGQPGWLNNERYNVEAKMDPAVADALHKLSAVDQKPARKHMMQVLVQDRMKVTVHMDSKEIAIYEMTIAKNGMKMKEVTDPNAPQGSMRFSAAGGSSAQCVALNMPTSGMLGQFSAWSGRPVYDKTGLTGKYDFTLKFTSERLLSAGALATDAAPALESAPPLMQAIEEQLGLKLVSAKATVDVIVIDHVERPSAN